jgi:hypothetical protein
MCPAVFRVRTPFARAARNACVNILLPPLSGPVLLVGPFHSEPPGDKGPGAKETARPPALGKPHTEPRRKLGEWGGAAVDGSRAQSVFRLTVG